MEHIDQVYTVTLRDFPDISAIKKADMESRFSSILRRELGGDESVIAAYKAFDKAHNEVAMDLSREDIHDAARWAGAYEKARRSGFRDLADVHEAYFEIHII